MTSNTQTSALNNCSQCGCVGIIGSEEPYFSPDQVYYYVFHSHPKEAKDCSFLRDGATTPFFDNKEDAIDFWNKSYGYMK